jgi:hypothetical protein
MLTRHSTAGAPLPTATSRRAAPAARPAPPCGIT